MFDEIWNENLFLFTCDVINNELKLKKIGDFGSNFYTD